jgi:hypothetical protein
MNSYCCVNLRQLRDNGYLHEDLVYLQPDCAFVPIAVVLINWIKLDNLNNCQDKTNKHNFELRR